MPRLRLVSLVALLVVVAAPSGGAAGPAASRAAAGATLADPCPRSAALVPGAGRSALYRTVAPFEHFDPARSQLFPFTCTLRELTGRTTPQVRVRQGDGDYATPYIAATRDRDQLFVYGYRTDAARDGAYVASVSARTLRERWRTVIRDAEPADAWSYPGVLLVHRNGDLYAVYANNLVRLDPASGRVKRRLTLPEDPGGTGAAYNGMTVLADGTLAVKGIERGPCAPGEPSALAPGRALSGLICAGQNALPTPLLLVDPERLVVLDRSTTLQPVTGRITATRFRGRTFIYCAGADSLFRYEVTAGHRLRRDTGWGPVRYRTGEEKPGTGPGVLGDWIVVQTNFLPSSAPLRVTAASQADSRRVHTLAPFAAAGQTPDSTGAPLSFEVSKAAIDVANARVYTHDSLARRLTALRFDPVKGFSRLWAVPNRSLGFSALVGPTSHRELVFNDAPDEGGDQAVWYDAATGRERLRSGRLSELPAPGNIITPGFAGRFYYLSSEGKLNELRPVAPGAP